MNITRLPRTGDAIKVVITADDGAEHRFSIWEENGDDGAKGIAAAVERVKRRTVPQPLDVRAPNQP